MAGFLSRLQATVEKITSGLETYDNTSAAKALEEMTEELSTWYLRCSRQRFWDQDPQAAATLSEALRVMAQLLAPFCPFLASELFESQATEEVHLSSWPLAKPNYRNPELEQAMGLAQELCSLGRSLRAEHGVALQQPLASATVLVDTEQGWQLQSLLDLLLQQLNVKEVRFGEQAQDLGHYLAFPDFKKLGPRLGAHVQLLKAKLNKPELVSDLLEHGKASVTLEGQVYLLESEDLELRLVANDDQGLAQSDNLFLVLDFSLTAELLGQGLVRELVRALQEQRKAQNFSVSDRERLTLKSSPSLLKAVTANQECLQEQLLATELKFGTAQEQDQVSGGTFSFRLELLK